jgi:hypothetical protein
LLPAQHWLPGVPQVAQTPLDVDVLLHTKALPRQMLVALLLDEAGVVVQQVSPALFPHRAQSPDTHLVPAVVQ